MMFSKFTTLVTPSNYNHDIDDFIRAHKTKDGLTIKDVIKVKDYMLYFNEDDTLYAYNINTKTESLISNGINEVYYRGNHDILYLNILGRYYELDLATTDILTLDIHSSGNYERLVYQKGEFLYFTHVKESDLFILFKVSILTGEQIILAESNKCPEFPLTYSELNTKNWSFYTSSDYEKYVIGVDGYVKGYKKQESIKQPQNGKVE